MVNRSYNGEGFLTQEFLKYPIFYGKSNISSFTGKKKTQGFLKKYIQLEIS